MNIGFSPGNELSVHPDHPILAKRAHPLLLVRFSRFDMRGIHIISIVFPSQTPSLRQVPYSRDRFFPYEAEAFGNSSINPFWLASVPEFLP